MRACGISLYRTALPMVVVRARRQRAAVRHGRARARDREPARRSAEAPDPHRLAADLRRAQSQVDRRQRRRGLSLPVLRSAQARAEQPRRSSSSIRRRTRCKSRMFVQRATYDAGSRAGRARRPKWRLEQGWSREFDPKTQVSTFKPFENTTAPLRAGRLFRHRGARARADELRAAARLHHASCAPAATTCSSTRSACIARSPSRS